MTATLDTLIPLPVAPLERQTLQDQVYRALCELILNGEIAPGQQVTVRSLSDAFGVSAMPVREALKRLSAADAITVVAGRSIGIPRLTHERLVDLKNVRIEIEPLAAGWAVERIAVPELARLSEDLDHLESADRTGDVRAYLRANRAFHFTIYGASRSQVLMTIIEALWLQISPYFNLLHASGNYTTANIHHRRMLQALERRDRESVVAAMKADISSAYDVLSDLLCTGGANAAAG